MRFSGHLNGLKCDSTQFHREEGGLFHERFKILVARKCSICFKLGSDVEDYEKVVYAKNQQNVKNSFREKIFKCFLEKCCDKSEY